MDAVNQPLLDVRDLSVAFRHQGASSVAVDRISFDIKRRVYLDLLLWSGFIALIPVSRDILIETAALRAESRFKLPDAVHLVSAIQAQCRFFVSSDRDFDKIPQGMERVSCDPDGLSRLLTELS